MDLSSTANDNLRDYTRLLVGDPSAAPSTIWSDAEVDWVINQEYYSMMMSAMAQNSGIGNTVAFANSVADQIEYSTPTDWISWVSVEIDPDGGDMSADATITPIYLKPRNENVAMELHRTGNLSTVSYYFQRNTGETSGQFGIVKPPTTGGTNSIRLTYRKKPAVLTASLIPQFPEVFHDLICYRAAIVLKSSRDLPYGDLAQFMIPKQRAFDRWASDIHDDDYDFSIPAGGRVVRSRNFKSGSIKRP